jgi:hypothetical protein
MQFADYNAFRVAVQHVIEGDDYASNTFSTDTLDLFVGLGEARVFNGDVQTPGLRASTMVKPLALTITANAATLPADLLELKEVYFDGKPPLEIVPLDRLRALIAADESAADALFCAQDGDTLLFWPAATGTVLGRYYCRPEPLETATWVNATTFARYPEIFLYAAAYEGALFLGLSGQLPLWEARYRALLDGANHSERMRVYGGSPLRMRAR